MVEPLDLGKLGVFVRIAESGSFTRAACQLAIAQSALSRKMRDLEADLGLQLFHRNGRGVELTDAGHLFLERAKRLLTEAQGLVAEMKEHAASARGTVRLGIPPTLSCVLVAPLVTELGRAHPEIKLQVLEAFSGDIQQSLLDGSLDIGLLHGVRPIPTLFTEELNRESMFAVGPPGDPVLAEGPIRLADLVALPLVVPSRPHGIRILIDDASARARAPLNIRVELNGLGPMKELIASGLCYGILPSSAVGREVRAGQMSAVPIVEPTVSRTLVLTLANASSASRAVHHVAQRLKRIVVTLVAEGRWGLPVTAGDAAAAPRRAAAGRRRATALG